MNKFKKPYGKRTTSPRDARVYRSARAGEAFQKFDAVCSNCGKACQVPFRPDGVKPVYCKDCFGAPREALTGKAGKKKFSVGPAAGFSAPVGAGGNAAGGKSIADLTRQIAAMNTKIDTILKILTDGGAEEE